MPLGLCHFALSVGVCSLVDNNNNNRAADAASVVNPARSPLASSSASIASEGVGHDIEVQDQPIINQPQTGVSLDQIKDMLGSFSRTFEEKFAQMSSCIDNFNQDVIKSNNDSFSARTAVAGRAEPMPDKVPHCSYTDGRGSTLRGLAAAVAPAGADSPSHISFESRDRPTGLTLLSSSLWPHLVSHRCAGFICVGPWVINLRWLLHNPPPHKNVGNRA